MDKLTVGHSKVEEAIGGLHWIAAVLCFAYGFSIAAWLFVIRAVIDDGAAIAFAIKTFHARAQNTPE